MSLSASGLDPETGRPGVARPGIVRKTLGSRRARQVTIGLAIVLAYAALACLTTWPLVAHMRTHLPGDSTDALLHYWNGWWVQRALHDGRSPYYTPYLFYPNGLSLVTHNLAWFQILPWLILEPLIGGIAAYNVGILVNLTLCGCAAFVLTFKLTGDGRAAFLGGLIYQSWPYRLSQLDHPNLLATYWVPIFFLFLVLTLREGRWRNGIFAGISFALVGYTRWQQLIPVTLMALVYVLCSAPEWWPRGWRHTLLRLLVAAAVAAVALLPPAMLLLSRQADAEDAVNLLRAGEDEQMQTDVLAYLTPWDAHPLFGRVTRSLYERYYGDRPYAPNPAYVGLVALILAALGVYYRRWKSLGWVAMAVLLILLALGPILRVGGRLFHVPTLYGLLAPLVRLMRVPERFNVFLALPVSVLAAYGVAGLLARRPALTSGSGVARRPGILILVLVGCLVVFESLGVPVPLIDVSYIPSFYARIAEEPGDFALLDYPLRNSKDYMFEQTFHRRPILGGNISRLPEEAMVYTDEHPRLGFLNDPHNLPPEDGDVSRLLDALARDGIRYIVLHKARLGAEGVARWLRYLLVEPRYEDERVLVYVTAPQAGQDYSIPELAPGLGPVRVLLSAGCANPGGALELAVGWASTQPQEQDWDVLLSLVDASGQARQVTRYPLSETWPTSQWPPGTLAWEVYPLRLAPSLADRRPDGQHALRLELSRPLEENAAGPALPVGTIDVQQEPCHLATRPDARDANARFGVGLYLAEYSLAREADGESPRLDLTLYWQPAYRPGTDYKVFVHVYDPATGIPVAQYDGMPRNWAYPMTRWWPGEVVADPISIPLQGVPAGRYHIGVGVYDPATGERLPLVDGEGRSVEDGRWVLDETVEVK